MDAKEDVPSIIKDVEILVSDLPLYSNARLRSLLTSSLPGARAYCILLHYSIEQIATREANAKGSGELLGRIRDWDRIFSIYGRRGIHRTLLRFPIAL
jgi:hypothetical protein